jgi:hypothetical protein
MQDKASKDEVRLLRAQIGNLEVQVADYQQIVKELSNRLNLYENKHGTVFRSGKKNSTQK